MYAKSFSVSRLRQVQSQKVEDGDDEVARGVKRIYRHRRLKRLRSTAFGQAQLKKTISSLLEVITLNSAALKS